ncbi:MAG: glycosyltransferase [Firmicutes bacterium]|nr:glycosyltransferase [Bacillota bacterium]
MQPLLSIVIPIYNNEMTLKKMLDSILVQKIDDWELLLINDGSTDSCARIIDDYAKVDNRIKAFHKENGGTFSGYNVGLENATGKYITFCSADDTFTQNAFEIIAKQANEYDYDIILMNTIVHFCDNDQNIIESVSAYNGILTDSFKFSNKRDFEKCFATIFYDGFLEANVNAYKSSIIKKYCFTEQGDTWMNLLIANNISSVSYIHIPIYQHYIYIYIMLIKIYLFKNTVKTKIWHTTKYISKQSNY